MKYISDLIPGDIFVRTKVNAKEYDVNLIIEKNVSGVRMLSNRKIGIWSVKNYDETPFFWDEAVIREGEIIHLEHKDDEDNDDGR